MTNFIRRQKFLLSGVMLVAWLSLVPSAFSQLIDGVETGFTRDGVPYKGAADAPVVLIEYSDYLCPFCRRHHENTNPELVEKYVKSGQVRLEFRHFPIPQLHPTAAKGHEAAACVAEQGAVQFWKMHDALFTRQAEWNRLEDPDSFLGELVSELGFDSDAYASCRAEGKQKKTVEDSMAAGREFGFNGTPTFRMMLASAPTARNSIVGARPTSYFSEYADALLAGKEPPTEPEQPKRELPDWAKSESLTMDPDRSGYTMSGDPSYGDADARLVIVEFTDFQCPPCARHALETQPLVKSKLIDTGMVRWVTKNLPLPEHANAPAAAVAALCAGDQDHYWDMHQLLFEKQQSWSSVAEPDSELQALAAELGLDEKSFATCLGSRQALERILPSLHDAITVTRATPTFVVLDGESGRPIRGRLDPQKFVEAVQKHYESVTAADREKETASR